MGKRWAAGALAAVLLLWTVSALEGIGAAGDEPPAAVPAAVEAESPGGSLEDIRALPVTDVPAEGLDAARWAVYRDLLPLGADGRFDGEEPVSRAQAVQALYRLGGVPFSVGPCPYQDVPEEYRDAAASAAAWPRGGSRRTRR